MGIKNLNRYFRETCKVDAIKVISLSDLSNKKIVIDISIYIYKFEAENALIENIYLMLSIFRSYNIIPIFVFDGKPPAEKKELIMKRTLYKKEAEKEYKNLYDKLNNDNEYLDNFQKKEIMNTMNQLKKKFVYITKDKIDEVKHLIQCYGACYIEAKGEADKLCASMVLNKKAWACLSEDMDMFVYGCTRVIRYLSLLNHTVVLYDTHKILNNLELTQNDLREICVISGTDYNHEYNNNMDLTIILNKFKMYKKGMENENEKKTFYEWLNSIECIDYDKLIYINEMFDLTIKNDFLEIELMNNIIIENKPILSHNVKDILKKDGFIFPE
jgi:flap endonuclease-1